VPFLIVLITISACSTENSSDTYIYWTEKTDNQIERLNQANINDEIRDGEIWIREEGIRKVVACCS
jgi:hypothetical protein